MGIGNKLSDLLKERNMTVTELSRRINVAPTTIYSIIQRNNKKVDIDVLLDIADVLGVTAEYFRDSPKSEPTTLAAHFDGDEFTEDELDEIRQFAEFVKNRKK
ncbi:MAG TPA: helix-turn-helix domain-containing protein [Candidatus Bariatricus faecipullorum]|nr:helix-turn-helix domain-containing protein [Candidatus Bariatricus faecipullorum]